MKICRAAPPAGLREEKQEMGQSSALRATAPVTPRAHTSRGGDVGQCSGAGKAARARGAGVGDAHACARRRVQLSPETSPTARLGAAPKHDALRARVPPAMWQNNCSAPEDA